MMRCPACKRSGPTMVVDSRLTAKNQVRRRRRCPRGHKFTTYELPAPLSTPIATDVMRLFKVACDEAFLTFTKGYDKLHKPVEISR